MSLNLEESVEADDICACCGIAQVDDIKLEECDGCDLVKYCSDVCRENHSEQHEEECKKRKAELHDKELFEQPDGRHDGDCPICFLPMPIDERKTIFYSCCCKSMCKCCHYADRAGSGKHNCPFCREPIVYGDEENDKRVMERVKANDPAALRYMGGRLFDEGDYDKGVEYLNKAAEFGDARASYVLGFMYCDGEHIQKDWKRGISQWEKAAIGGDPDARYNLGMIEAKNNGNIERAVKHFIIAANLGYEKSMKVLWKHFSAGDITKEELEATLRSHKAAIDATKSVDRNAAEIYDRLNAAASR